GAHAWPDLSRGAAARRRALHSVPTRRSSDLPFGEPSRSLKTADVVISQDLEHLVHRGGIGRNRTLVLPEGIDVLTRLAGRHRPSFCRLGLLLTAATGGSSKAKS